MSLCFSHLADLLQLLMNNLHNIVIWEKVIYLHFIVWNKHIRNSKYFCGSGAVFSVYEQQLLYVSQMPVPLKWCCADVLLVHQQKEHNETSNSVNQIGFGLALCGALLYKLQWSLISGCSFSKASLVAGLWPAFSKTMRSWHNLFLISSTLHLCLHKQKFHQTEEQDSGWVPSNIFMGVQGSLKMLFLQNMNLKTKLQTGWEHVFDVPSYLHTESFPHACGHCISFICIWLHVKWTFTKKLARLSFEADLMLPIIPIIWWIQNIECAEYRHQRIKFLLCV